MEKHDIYRDIAERTGGDIYIGVVGPVRTGKSTLVKKFLELLVIPNVKDEFERQRTIDEMPQAGAGRTVMTSEPKFIPADGVEVTLNEGVHCRIRLVDSVGFPVEGALGYTEEFGPRMVTTPWFEYDIPFEEAAELGTRKVITDHSTIGLVVTTDGSFGEIPRENYVEAEHKTVEAIRELGKPYLIVLNTARPHDPNTHTLAAQMKDEYGATVIPLNCARLDEVGVSGLLEQVLYEFPVASLDIRLPGWVAELEASHWLRRQMDGAVEHVQQGIATVRDVQDGVRTLGQLDTVERVTMMEMDMGTGVVTVQMEAKEDLFYQALREITGVDLFDKQALIRLMRELTMARREFERMSEAWQEAQEFGYGVVMPGMAQMDFQEPEMVKKGNQFGVRLKVRAPSYHIMRADVEAEYTPILGTERQSEDLMNYLLEKFEDDPNKIWESNIFGKSLNELLRDGVRAKLQRMPENAQKKFQETLERIINEGGGGLICIII